MVKNNFDKAPSQFFSLVPTKNTILQVSIGIRFNPKHNSSSQFFGGKFRQSENFCKDFREKLFEKIFK
jgi:hypothetical protein